MDIGQGNSTSDIRKAIEYDPAYADAHHSYGLLLALTRAWDQALAELREAVRLDPKSAQNHIDYGDALAGKRRGAALKLHCAAPVRSGTSH